MTGFDFGGFDGPDEWLVCFHERAATWWVRLIPGRFKHVSAIGVCKLGQVWVGIDPAVDRTRIWAWRNTSIAHKRILEWTDDALVVAMPARSSRSRLRLGGWCVPVIGSLIGIGGALRPDALLRSCLRNGGRIMFDGEQGTDTSNR